MIVQTPRATAGTASAAAPRRLRRTIANALAAQTQKIAARSIPRPNSRPNRVAWMADATGPRWSKASQNETPATSAPCRVSAAQPPASIRTAAAVKSWVARIRSRRSAIARGCPSSVATTGPPHDGPEDDAADHERQAAEIGEPRDQERPVERRRLHLRRLGRRPARAEPDREDARDDVAVGRDDAPADGVVAVREGPSAERNDQGPHVAGCGVGGRRRHVVALGVRHRARDVAAPAGRSAGRSAPARSRRPSRPPGSVRSRFAWACAVAGKAAASRSATGRASASAAPPEAHRERDRREARARPRQGRGSRCRSPSPSNPWRPRRRASSRPSSCRRRTSARRRDGASPSSDPTDAEKRKRPRSSGATEPPCQLIATIRWDWSRTSWVVKPGRRSGAIDLHAVGHGQPKAR